MGPTNVALVKLFRADAELREAQNRLEEAGKNVRLQERRVADLDAKLKDAQARQKQQQSRAGQLDLDMRARDAHIEKLRTQQQSAKNNKEYQAFLVEINTAKVDRGKVEDEAVRVMGEVEKGQQEVAALVAALDGERTKLTTIKSQLADTIARHQAEVDALKPARDAAQAALPQKVVDAFNRLADRYEGDALSALSRPDRRREEYLCTACNMELAIDIYNKLHSRDEIVFCPNCRRILYIPEELTPEAAISTGKSKGAATGRTRAKKSAGAGAAGDDGAAGAAPVTIEKRAKGDLGNLLNRAQGESVQAAVVSGSNPVDCEVYIDNELAGYYKGRDPGHLERNIKYRLEEVGKKVDLRVVPATKPAGTEQPAESADQPADTTPAAGGAEAMAEAEAESSSSPQG
jgi:predicted  nucleic acid-binding Zn-ribbon protein